MIQYPLPFGTALESESTGSTNRRFTSYDRSVSTGLDYAINRFYDSSQGRFTQVDPITMDAASLMNPQSLNLYAYTENDPVNRVDPDGKFWGFISGLISFFRSFFRNTNFSVNFNFRGIPLSFGFQGHFRNVYVGVAGFNVQVTGRDSIFNLFRKNQQSNNQTLFDEAVDAVRGILLNPASSCSEFFGAFGYSAFKQMIAKVTFDHDNNTSLGISMALGIPQYQSTGLPKYGHPFMGGGAWYGYFAPKSFVVNTNGPFITPGGNVAGMGNYPSGSLRIRALQLLHELGHITITGTGFVRKGVPKGFVRAGLLLEVDGGNPSLSVSNTKKVLKHCKSEIDAL